MQDQLFQLLDDIVLDGGDYMPILLMNNILRYGVIAGGSLLSFCGNKYEESPKGGTFDPFPEEILLGCKLNDFDIYMTRDNFVNFCEYLESNHSNRPKYMKFLYSGLADMSQGVHFHLNVMTNIPLDIVVVDDIDTCIRNFDLTCCKIALKLIDDVDWENLERLPREKVVVEMLHPMHIYTKSTELSAPFALEYLNGNKTTRQRVEKYMHLRKFDIRFPVTQEHMDGSFVTMKYSNYHRLFNNRSALTRGQKMLRMFITQTNLCSEGDLLPYHLIKKYEETLDFYNEFKQYVEMNQLSDRCFGGEEIQMPVLQASDFPGSS